MHAPFSRRSASRQRFKFGTLLNRSVLIANVEGHPHSSKQLHGAQMSELKPNLVTYPASALPAVLAKSKAPAARFNLGQRPGSSKYRRACSRKKLSFGFGLCWMTKKRLISLFDVDWSLIESST